MLSARAPMYVVKPSGRAYFEPSPFARRVLGMKTKSLGYDGVLARDQGWRIYEEVEKHKAAYHASGRDPLKDMVWPKGSLGAFFNTFRERRDFKQKAQKTQDGYWTAWLKIGPTFGDWQLDQIHTDAIEEAVGNWEDWYGPHVRYRALAKLKELLAHAHARVLIPVDPSTVIKNPMPPPRQETWLPQEITALANEADRQGFGGLSLAIRLMYETGISPVDARTLLVRHVRADADGAWIERARTKSKKAFVVPISDALFSDIEFAMADKTDDDIVITQTNGRPFAGSNGFAYFFRKVREEVFGPDEQRRMQDIRRTFNVEMDIGGASPEERAQILANSLNTSSRLEQTYTPPNVVRARQVAAQRREGQALREQMSRGA